MFMSMPALSGRFRSLLPWVLSGLLIGSFTAFVPACSNNCSSSADCAAGLLCLATPGASEKTCQQRPDGVGNQELPDKPEFPGDAGGKDDGNPPPDRRDPPGDRPNPNDQPPGDNNPGDTTTADKVQPSGKAPVKGDLVINEVHADPKSGAGDANGDGTTSSSQDEFIEFVNTTDGDIDLSGVTLATDKDIITFAVGTTLPAKTAVVVFGGGLDGDADANSGKPHPGFGDSLVYTKSLSLTNSGKKIILKDKDGNELDAFGYGKEGTDCPGDKDQSVTLWPDLTGKCTLHTTAGAGGKQYSPGTRVDGGKFSDAPPPPMEPAKEVAPDAGGGETTTPDNPPVDNPPVDKGPADTGPTGPTPQAGELVINEILPDPGGEEVNKDGSQSNTQDEFVEIVNVSSKTLQVGGLKLYLSTSTSRVYTLKPLMLPPKGVLVIFAGGMANDNEAGTGKPHTKFGGAYVYSAGVSILSNSGTREVILETAQGTKIASFAYGSGSCKVKSKVSLNLNPELTGTCALHTAVQTGSNYSPGTKADGSKF